MFRRYLLGPTALKRDCEKNIRLPGAAFMDISPDSPPFFSAQALGVSILVTLLTAAGAATLAAASARTGKAAQSSPAQPPPGP